MIRGVLIIAALLIAVAYFSHGGVRMPSAATADGPTATPAGVLLRGDINCDGYVRAIDGLLLVVHAAGIAVSQPPECPQVGGNAVIVGAGPILWGDVDCDGDVDLQDGLALIAYVAGVLFPGCDIGAVLGDVVPAP